MTWVIYKPDEKRLKGYWKVRIELSINNNSKSPQIYTLPQFLGMWQNNAEFTDSTHTIYWPTDIAQKAGNCWKKYLPISTMFMYFDTSKL